MKRDVALIGGGGHAVSVMEMVPPHISVTGYVDPCMCNAIKLPYLGNDEEFERSCPDMPVHIAVVMGKDGGMGLRRKVIERYADREMPILVAEDAVVTHSSVIGRGSAVMHRAVVNGATLGECNVVNTGAIVEHGVITGSNVFIGPGAVVCGGVSAGGDVMIGAGALIRNNVTIVSGAVIGMGSVVVKDILQPGVYAGNPCRKL